MGRLPPSPKAVAECLRLIASGLPEAEVARQLEVTPSTIGRWRARYSAPVPEPVPLAVALPPPPPPGAAAPVQPAEPPTDESEIDTMRALLRDARANAAEARAVGNWTAAQRATKTATDVARDLDRAKKRLREDGDGVLIPRNEIDDAARSVRERIKMLTHAGPLHCARCGVELRIADATARRGDELDD